MKIKLTILIIFLLIFAGVGLFWGRRKVGDIRPVVFPPGQKTKEEPSEVPLTLTQGFRIGLFATDLGKARDLEISPGGTLLLSIPATSRLVALPDKNGDGVADEVKPVLTGLGQPHGLAFFGGKLFVAEETRVVRYSWDEKNLSALLDKVLFSLPKGGRHFTRTLAFGQAGRMFVSIGSTCDVCFEKHPWLGAVVVSDSEGKDPRLWAKGLRNSVFIAVNPQSSELWGTEMGRDFLGDFLPPDEINIIREGRDYGWPLCFGNRVHDTDFDKKVYIQIVPQPPCGTTEPPVYEIAAHSAPLGLAFVDSPQFPKDWQGDLLVAYHGSWNRSTPIGYKVVRLDVEGEKIVGEEDFISGFLEGSEAIGRPVDLIFDPSGNLFISDDKAGVVYRVIR